MSPEIVDVSLIRPSVAELEPTFGMPHDFQSAVRSTLRLLHSRLGFETWFLIRVEGAQCIVLHSEDHHFDLKTGQLLSWEDLVCYRLMNGEGPCIVPRLDDVPAYKMAPIAQQHGINAYIGVPIKRRDGSLFDMVVAIDSQEQPEACVNELPMVELFGSLLGTILDHEMASAEQTRLAERERALSMRDALTGVFNRRGWDVLSAAEESRCRRYGHPACVLSIDLDRLKQTNDTLGHSAGDDLIRRAAKTLKLAAREVDIVARVGGDEFLVLLVECSLEGGQAFVGRLTQEFDTEGVEASIGLVAMQPNQSVASVIEEADRAMYRKKRSRRVVGMQGSCP